MNKTKVNSKTIADISSICQPESALVKYSDVNLIKEKFIDYISISNCLNPELAEYGFKC